MKNFVALFFFFSTFFLSFSQENFPFNGIKAKHKPTYAFINGNIHVNENNIIKRGIILIEDNIIIDVGLAVDIPEYAIVENLNGAHVYASFIDPHTNYGCEKLTSSSWSPKPQIESENIGPFSWNESLKPEYHSSNYFSPDNSVRKNYIKNGFGVLLSFQNDGIVRGTSSIVNLSSIKPQKALIKSKATAHYSFNKGQSKQSYPSSFMGSIALIRQAIYDALWANHNNLISNISLIELYKNLKLPAFFEIDNHYAIRNVINLKNEFKMTFVIKGVGDEYMSINSEYIDKSMYILPLNFPKKYNVNDNYNSLELSLAKMKHWELAPANPAILESKNIEFAFTTNNLENIDDFLPNIRTAIKHGLSEEGALRAITTLPAKMLNIDDKYGSLKPGMVANFIICDVPIFDNNSTILENWTLGKKEIINEIPKYDYRGEYLLKIDGEMLPLEIYGEHKNMKGRLLLKDTIKVEINFENNLISLKYNDNNNQIVRLSGSGEELIEGEGSLGNGDWTSFVIKLKGKLKKNTKKDATNKKFIDTDKVKFLNEMGEKWFPNNAYGWIEKPKVRNIIFENFTLWTNEAFGIIKNSSIAIADGKIIAVGNDAVDIVKNKYDFEIINGQNKHLTSGIIDEHSHIGLRSVNESGQNNSAEVRMTDAIRPNDINIYRQLSGGVTCAQLLHGSANPIGGQSAIIKMKWGGDAEELIYNKAKPFIKFALGENVKQSNWGDYNSVRYPQTRMGVEQVFFDSFINAKDYVNKWKKWDQLSSNQKKDSKMPRKDLELEVISEILSKKRYITCHSYRQSEINMLMNVADSLNFKINTFTHILEGYKVADKMKIHGAGASTFSDWWAYKYEVNDAIPYNAAILNKMNIITAINSDDAEMGKRLNQEAAKSIKYGNISQEDAWKLITLNPAKLLHIDDNLGSLKKGKDADIVIWTENPLSIYSVVEQTYIDGKLYYSIETNKVKQAQNKKEKNRLIQKMLNTNSSKEFQKISEDKKYRFHCDDDL